MTTRRMVRARSTLLGVYCLFLLAMHLVGRANIPAVLTDGISLVVICQWGVQVEVRGLCVPPEALQSLQKKLAPLGTGTW